MSSEFWVIDWCYTLGFSIRKARRFTEQEKSGYAEWYQNIGMVALDEQAIDLPYLTTLDLPDRQADGEFNGFGNQAYIITDDDVKHYTALNAARERDAKEKELNDRRNYYRSLIKAAEKQDKLYTPEEAEARRKAWINLQNEGGEGYVPHFYTIDEVEAAKHWIDEHQEEK